MTVPQSEVFHNNASLTYFTIPSYLHLWRQTCTLYIVKTSERGTNLAFRSFVSTFCKSVALKSGVFALSIHRQDVRLSKGTFKPLIQDGVLSIPEGSVSPSSSGLESASSIIKFLQYPVTCLKRCIHRRTQNSNASNLSLFPYLSASYFPPCNLSLQKGL